MQTVYLIIVTAVIFLLIVLAERMTARILRNGELRLRIGRSKLSAYDRFPVNLFFRRRLVTGYRRLRDGETQYSKCVFLHRVEITVIGLIAIILIGLVVKLIILL